MFRIDNPTAATALAPIPAVGTPGYFTKGNPAAGGAATILDDWWLNTIQEEILTVIINAGLTPDKNDHTQLFQALQRLTRVRLNADTTFYVADTGDDNLNTGMSPTSPFATITHAYNFIRDRVDINGYVATIQLADGIYTGAQMFYPVPGPHVVLRGNTIDPTKTQITNNAGPGLFLQFGAYVEINSVILRSTGVSGDYIVGGYGLAVFDASAVLNNVWFDACSEGHMTADLGGNIGMTADNVPYAISAAAQTHAYAARGSVIACAGAVISISNTPTFAGAFVRSDRGATIDYHGASFVGGAHGKRYYASTAAVINTGSSGDPNFFPGDAAGTTDNGGIYW